MQKAYKFSFMVTQLKIGSVWVLFNWLNTKNVSLDDPQHPLYIILETGQKFIRPFLSNGTSDDFDYLAENHFLVKDQDVVRDIVCEQYAHAVDRKHLSLTLMPVNQACNFRCLYCYEDKSKNHLMGDVELKALIRYVRNYKPETLRIDYFGGEPLLNLDFIKRVNSGLMEIEEECGFVLTPSSMTTNGYLLTKDVFLSLHDLRITSYQVTIDGDKENHDLLRPHVNGLGSYDVIYRNLRDMASTDKKFSLTLRMNFSPKTSTPEARQRFLERIQQDFGNDKRFILMPDMISRWRDNEKRDVNMHCTKTDGIKIKQIFEQEAEAIGIETLSMVLLCGPESHFCYAGKPNNMVIYPCDESGNLPVQKCTLEISRSSNNVGHITQDGVFVENYNWASWVKSNLFKAQKCRNCFFVLNCFGNACVYKNNKRGKIICPREKRQEKVLVPRILSYIDRNLAFIS